MQMCATLVCNTKNENEQSIICVNYVLSGNQYGHVVMDREQVDQPLVRIKPDLTGSEHESVGAESPDTRGRSHQSHDHGGGICNETDKYPVLTPTFPLGEFMISLALCC